VCAFYYCLIRFYAGDPLSQVLDAAIAYRKLSPQYGQHFVIPNFDVLIQLLLNLMGKAIDPLKLSGDAVQEGDAVEAWQTKNTVAFLLFLNGKHILAVYLNEHGLARALAKKIQKAQGKMSPIAAVTHRFLQAIASGASIAQRRRLLGKLKESARHCPDNFLHKVYLVEAEVAVTDGLFDEAMTKYNMSIAQAERQGFVHEQALACERAGYALRQNGNRQGEAKHFLTQASSLYGQWGAQVKVNQLAEELAHNPY
jgi:hypothetical protein